MLRVVSSQQAQFEAAFRQASTLICSIEGYQQHQLLKCVEVEDKYLLLVEWETLEAHMINFRQSSEYEKWRALLHHFYDPFPVVEHFMPVDLNV